MKFLCVPCDKPMMLADKKGPDDGSVTLVYSCDDCGYEMAMLTNAFETQLVSSLGVTIGPDGSKQAGASKCPFTGMLQGMGDDAPTAPGAAGASRDAHAGTDAAPPPASAREFPWTAAAMERLATIPSFIRPMAKSGIEQFARDKGYPEIDETVLAEARSHFGM